MATTSSTSPVKSITCLVAGDGNVGKSTFIKWFNEHQANVSGCTCGALAHNGMYKVTFPVECLVTDPVTKQRRLSYVNVTLVEADETTVEAVAKDYGTEYAILMVDIVSEEAISSYYKWLGILSKKCGITDMDNIGVVGNKTDLTEFSEYMQMIYNMHDRNVPRTREHVSSLTGENICVVINEIVDRALKN
jgi:GTPase SAR1 family protein